MIKEATILRAREMETEVTSHPLEFGHIYC